MPDAMPNAIAAIVYSGGIYPDRLIAEIVAKLEARGVELAGVVQRDETAPGRSRCDMALQDLGSGRRISISEDRGAEARGCRIDLDGLLAASTAISHSLLRKAPRLLIINKFGKVEAEGGGLRDVIAEALSRDIPVLIAVPSRNLASWRSFAGEFAREYARDDAALWQWVEANAAATAPVS